MLMMGLWRCTAGSSFVINHLSLAMGEVLTADHFVIAGSAKPILLKSLVKNF